jgi:hypothetical protein
LNDMPPCEQDLSSPCTHKMKEETSTHAMEVEQLIHHCDCGVWSMGVMGSTYLVKLISWERLGLFFLFDSAALGVWMVPHNRLPSEWGVFSHWREYQHLLSKE